MTEATETGTYFEWVGGELRPYALAADQQEREEEDFDAWVKRIGYKWEGINDGLSDALRLRLYRNDGKASHAFLVIMEDADTIRCIFLPSFDSMLRFRVMLAPLVSQVILDVQHTKIVGLAAKSFRAWHGHHDEDICDRCDPEEMQQRRRTARAIKADGKT